MHFSNTMPEIVQKLTLVVTSSAPSIDALSKSFVIYIVTFIALAAIGPGPEPIPDSIFELSLVHSSVIPIVDTIALWLAIGIEPLVSVPVGEYLDPPAMFVPTLDLPLVVGYVGVDFAYSFGPVEFPGAFVVVLARVPPAGALLHAVDESAHVQVPVLPQK